MRTIEVVFLVASFLVRANAENEEEIRSCAVPPQPRHGSYTFNHISEEKYMGQPKDFILNVTCDSGYGLVGESRVACLAGHWFDQMPECIPLCKESKPSVITCVAKDDDMEHKCFLENSLISQTSSKQLHGVINTCGTEPLATLKIIAGGRQTNGPELPWHAAIYTKTTNPYMQICGGTLVSKTVVLSAAHCFWSEASQQMEPKEDYAIALGKIYRPWNADDHDAQKFDVSDIKIPPRFQGSVTNFQDDIAIVMLSGEVSIYDDLKPICLSFDYSFDKEQLKPGALGKIGGWGLTSEDGNFSPMLMVAELPYIDIGTCIAGIIPSFKPHITSDKICAGYTNGTAVCKGDSGGGLSFRNGRRYYLRGIVSTAPTSGHLCNVYTWATFTHIQKHEHFIREFLEFQEPMKEEEI